MIDLIFYFGTEIIFVRIQGKNVTFANSGYGMKMAPIDGLKLSYTGVVKEFPDLKDNENWKEEGIKRFKKHLSTFETEDEISQYIIKDLKSHGYVPKFMQKAGFRRKKVG